jgi:hypothetical protein
LPHLSRSTSDGHARHHHRRSSHRLRRRQRRRRLNPRRAQYGHGHHGVRGHMPRGARGCVGGRMAVVLGDAVTSYSCLPHSLLLRTPRCPAPPRCPSHSCDSWSSSFPRRLVSSPAAKSRSTVNVLKLYWSEKNGRETYRIRIFLCEREVGKLDAEENRETRGCTSERILTLYTLHAPQSFTIQRASRCRYDRV